MWLECAQWLICVCGELIIVLDNRKGWGVLHCKEKVNG